MEAPRAPRAARPASTVSARADRDTSSRAQTPDPLAALKWPPWPMHPRWQRWRAKPWSPGSLACRPEPQPWLPTLQALLLQRQVRSTQYCYCDLRQCYCGIWVDAPGDTIITLFSSCDVWREQGEGAASDPRIRYLGSCPGTNVLATKPASFGSYCCYIVGSRLVQSAPSVPHLHHLHHLSRSNRQII